MKVFTYYRHVPELQDAEMLDVWRHSWSRQGWECVVLCPHDVPHYAREFLDANRGYFLRDTPNPRDYEMACWERWAALGELVEPRVLHTDFDVVNLGFRAEHLPRTRPEDLVVLQDNSLSFVQLGATYGAPLTYRRVFEQFCGNARANRNPGTHLSDENLFREHVRFGVPGITFRLWDAMPYFSGMASWHDRPRLVHVKNHCAGGRRTADFVRRSFPDIFV